MFKHKNLPYRRHWQWQALETWSKNKSPRGKIDAPNPLWVLTGQSAVRGDSLLVNVLTPPTLLSTSIRPSNQWGISVGSVDLYLYVSIILVSTELQFSYKHPQITTNFRVPSQLPFRGNPPCVFWGFRHIRPEIDDVVHQGCETWLGMRDGFFQKCGF